MRQIVLDTETTGLDIANNHRIIEIAGVELINRKLTKTPTKFILIRKEQSDDLSRFMDCQMIFYPTSHYS